MTSKPLVRRTLATLRRAEFGFLGVVVYTRVQTPRRCGQFSSAGLLLLSRATSRGLRTSWLMVGMTFTHPVVYVTHLARAQTDVFNEYALNRRGLPLRQRAIRFAGGLRKNRLCT